MRAYVTKVDRELRRPTQLPPLWILHWARARDIPRLRGQDEKGDGEKVVSKMPTTLFLWRGLCITVGIWKPPSVPGQLHNPCTGYHLFEVRLKPAALSRPAKSTASCTSWGSHQNLHTSSTLSFNRFYSKSFCTEISGDSQPIDKTLQFGSQILLWSLSPAALECQKRCRHLGVLKPANPLRTVPHIDGTKLMPILYLASIL